MDPEFCYSVHKNQPLAPVHTQTQSHLQTFYLQDYLIINLSPVPVFSNLLLTFRFSDYKFACLGDLAMRAASSAHFSILNFINVKIFNCSNILRHI
jgi:hypothetical protein